MFAVDSSGSITREDFQRVVQFVGSVVQSLVIRTDQKPNGFQVALVSFADRVDVRFHLNTFTNKELMLAAISAHYTHGRTDISQALRYSLLHARVGLVLLRTIVLYTRNHVSPIRNVKLRDSHLRLTLSAMVLGETFNPTVSYW